MNADPSRVIGSAAKDWTGWFRVGINRPASEEEADELRESKRRLEAGLNRVRARWRQAPGEKFDAWFEDEAAAHGDASILDYVQAANTIRVGTPTPNSFPNNSFRLISDVLFRLEAAGIQSAEQLAKAREFFASSIFRQIPVVRIGSAMWAGLAHCFRNRQAENPSAFNDIAAISTYLPFCDAMFLDKECANLLTSNPVMTRVAHKAQIFSLQTKDNFLSYLKGIEASAPDGHLEKVHAVYGKFWLRTF